MTVTYVQNSDVQAHLNATFDGMSTYTIYGLTMQQATFQSLVDCVNTYINSVFGYDLSPGDPRYSFAKLAALNLACRDVLVVSCGGSLVGAFDYFLGDMRVARAGPYATAIKHAIDGFDAEFSKLMVNVATPAMVGSNALADDVSTYTGGLINP